METVKENTTRNLGKVIPKKKEIVASSNTLSELLNFYFSPNLDPDSRATILARPDRGGVVAYTQFLAGQFPDRMMLVAAIGDAISKKAGEKDEYMKAANIVQQAIETSITNIFRDGVSSTVTLQKRNDDKYIAIFHTQTPNKEGNNDLMSAVFGVNNNNTIAVENVYFPKGMKQEFLNKGSFK